MIAAMASFLCSNIPATPSTDAPYNFTVSLNFLHFRNNTDTPLQKLPAAPGDIPSLFAVDMPGNKVPPFHNSMFSWFFFVQKRCPVYHLRVPCACRKNLQRLWKPGLFPLRNKKRCMKNQKVWIFQQKFISCVFFMLLQLLNHNHVLIFLRSAFKHDSPSSTCYR